MSYHLMNIHKHAHNSPFKLMEESYEYIDALTHNNKIMAAVELSDLLGAVLIQANKLGYTLSDLVAMNDATTRAFNGKRDSFNLIRYLKENAEDIIEFGLGFIQVKIDNYNYNFYTNKVPKFSNHDEPHNHQTDFVSEILSGTLVENIYQLKKGHYTIDCVCGDESVKLKDVDYDFVETLTHTKGTLYYREKDIFHSVASDNAITKVCKFGSKTDAFVFGNTTEYQSEKTKEQLWDIVTDMCEMME